jgi:3-dehydroquinate dehydratase / shikimate dehydrogenase
MLIAVVPVKDYHSAKQKIKSVSTRVDGVELRLDYLQIRDMSAVSALRHACTLPVIFTLRKVSQGGVYNQDEAQRLQDISRLCQLKPDYLDIEYDVPENFVQNIKLNYPAIKLICSYHNFTETPEDLTAVLQSLRHPCFYAYKIATWANKTQDALRMLRFMNRHHREDSLTGICMGEEGQSTRILSAVVGSAMNYAVLDDQEKTAPGQLTVDELLTIYHFRALNTMSNVYALLGDPVHLSVGHVLHNQAIQFLQKNAVYLKLRVSCDELPSVIAQCRHLPFYGLSITMPLKECILPLLDEVECSSPIKAVNSVVRQEEKYSGFNSDGMGAIQALSDKVEVARQKIVILGAGGAARAIAYEACRHKAEVVILNRTLNRATRLAKELGCKVKAYDLNHRPCLKDIGYTVLINTLPEVAYAEPSLQELIQPHTLLPHTVAMDIVYQPVNTSFLQIAQQAHCICIFGYEMYIYQALMQIQHWFQPSERELEEIKNRMRCYFAGRPPPTAHCH